MNRIIKLNSAVALQPLIVDKTSKISPKLLLVTSFICKLYAMPCYLEVLDKKKKFCRLVIYKCLIKYIFER